MKERHIMCIDLKSFFASAECIQRGLDPFTTPLVVADVSRGNGAMCLAVTPYLRDKGVPSRCRVFTLPKNINIIYAPPRMKLYSTMSKKVVNIYKSFISEEDMNIYSIDECFFDVTEYLNYYKMTDVELAKTMMKKVKDDLGLTSTCGIGPNLLLAKVAMDTEAKHNKDFISKWTYEDIEKKLWELSPISKVWGIGRKFEQKLNNLGIYKIKDMLKYNREFYIKRFGKVSGGELWNKANGICSDTIKDLNKDSKDKSMSMSQILNKDYRCEDALIIAKEMNDMLCKQLREEKKVTGRITFGMRYSRELNKNFYDSITLSEAEDRTDKIFEYMKYIYDKMVEEDLPIRQVFMCFSRLQNKKVLQLNLFEEHNLKDEAYDRAIDKIKDKYGSSKLLRASSLLENSTIKAREKFKNQI